MVVAFDAKLRMAAKAIGCTSRKEICARFRAVNPATQCDLDRLNKWVQGRSLPRSASVYDDLARVIGTTKTGRWVAGCDLDDFAAELAALTGTDVAILTKRAADQARSAPGAGGLFGGVATLAGAYAAYSPAWSPHFKGRLVRGSLRLTPGGGGLSAFYNESLMGQSIRMTGDARFNGRSMHLPLREPGSDLPLFISLHVPGPPASVLCGVMSGVAFVARDTLPSASRVLFVRVADSDALEQTNRYFDPATGAIAADLADLGLQTPNAARFDALARALLAVGADQVTADDLSAFASILDREHLPEAC